MVVNRNLEAAVDYLDVAIPAADVGLGALSRAIRPLADGTLVVTNAKGVDRTLAVKADLLEPIQVSAIKVGTTCAVRVYR